MCFARCNVPVQMRGIDSLLYLLHTLSDKCWLAVLLVGTEQAWQKCVWNALSNFTACGSLPEQHDCLHTRLTAVCCRCPSIDRPFEACVNSDVSAASSHLHTGHTLIPCLFTFSSPSCPLYACKLSSKLDKSLLSSPLAAHSEWLSPFLYCIQASAWGILSFLHFANVACLLSSFFSAQLALLCTA